MISKAIARYFYARVPGVARARFALKDTFIAHVAKPEYSAAAHVMIGSGTIIDIGAHRGEGIAAFRRMHPASQIVAFEPLPRSVDYLSKKFATDSRIKIYGCALGNENKDVTLFVPNYGRWNCDGVATTIQDEAKGWLDGKVIGYDRSMHKLEEHQIQSRTLDSFGLAPSLIKMHAQNAEISILEGALQTLEKHHPALMCAFPTKDVLHFLDGLGYLAYHLENKTLVYGPQKDHRTTFTWFM